MFDLNHADKNDNGTYIIIILTCNANLLTNSHLCKLYQVFTCLQETTTLHHFPGNKITVMEKH